VQTGLFIIEIAEEEEEDQRRKRRRRRRRFVEKTCK